MYWPIGAPRIYAASDNKTPKGHAPDDGPNIQQSGISGGVEAVGTVDETVGSGVDVGNGETGSKAGEKDDENDNHLNQRPGDGLSLSGPQTPSSNGSGGIIGLRVSRNGFMFATITTTTLTIWQTRVCFILTALGRSN